MPLGEDRTRTETALKTLRALLIVALTGIDLAVRMPAVWTWAEGPPTVLVGFAFVALARRAAGGGTANTRARSA